MVRVLARNHRFERDDPRAVFIWDTVEDAELVDKIFSSMTVFLGCIALVTLDAGRCGSHEHHAGGGGGAHARDRLAQSLGRHQPPDIGGFPAGRNSAGRVQRPGRWLGAYGLAAAVNQLPKQEMFAGLPVDGGTTAMAFGALAVIAVASAMWPAWRAAHPTPVEALRL